MTFLCVCTCFQVDPLQNVGGDINKNYAVETLTNPKDIEKSLEDMNSIMQEVPSTSRVPEEIEDNLIEFTGKETVHKKKETCGNVAG